MTDLRRKARLSWTPVVRTLVVLACLGWQNYAYAEGGVFWPTRPPDYNVDHLYLHWFGATDGGYPPCQAPFAYYHFVDYDDRPTYGPNAKFPETYTCFIGLYYPDFGRFGNWMSNGIFGFSDGRPVGQVGSYDWATASKIPDFAAYAPNGALSSTLRMRFAMGQTTCDPDWLSHPMTSPLTVLPAASPAPDGCRTN